MNTDMKDFLAAMSANLSAADLIYASAASDVAVAVSEKRIESGLTQKEFAQLLGKSQTAVSKIENADCNLTLRTLSEIAQKLDLTLEIKLTPNVHSTAHNSPSGSNIVVFPGGYCANSSLDSSWTTQPTENDFELMEM